MKDLFLCNYEKDYMASLIAYQVEWSLYSPFVVIDLNPGATELRERRYKVFYTVFNNLKCLDMLH